MYNTDLTMKYLGAIANVLMIISYAQYWEKQLILSFTFLHVFVYVPVCVHGMCMWFSCEPPPMLVLGTKLGSFGRA